MVTASKIPVPEPIAPKKSAITDKAPIQRPPKAAAVGIYLFKVFSVLDSLCPLITICCSLSCLATSLADDPDTSIQVFEKNAQVPRINVR